MPTVDELAYLRAPVETADLEWVPVYTRAAEKGKGPLVLVSPFINRTAIINRLIQVCGPDGFATDARASDGHLSVGIGIRIERKVGEEIQAEWVWKWDGTGYLEASGEHFTPADAGRGDYSNGLKRTAILWGIGLDLKEIRGLPAIVNQEGRYKTKIGNQVVRWDPPAIPDGKFSRPGEVESLKGTRDEGGPPPRRRNVPPPKDPTEEQLAAMLQDAKDKVRGFMRRYLYQTYHLDALVQTHPKLKDRFGSGEDLGKKGLLVDWQLVAELTERNQNRWDDAPKELAKEFPTSEERVTRLRELMQAKRPNNQEKVVIESAIAAGWNDGVEYWLEVLAAR